MTDKQRLEEKLFVEKLIRNGWKADLVSEILHSGVFITPEGNACLNKDSIRMVLEYYAEDGELILIIDQHSATEYIRLQFNYGNHFEKVLDWVTRNQEKLNPHSFSILLRNIYPFCEQIFFIDIDDKKYTVQLSEDIEDNKVNLLPN